MVKWLETDHIIPEKAVILEVGLGKSFIKKLDK